MRPRQFIHIEICRNNTKGNGQVERLNKTRLVALLPSVPEEELWDEQVRSVQFASNNVENKSTGKTPSQLLFRCAPRNGSGMLLIYEIKQISEIIENLVTLRENAFKQNHHFDKKIKKSKQYKGDLIVIIKQVPSTGTSRKLAPI